MTYYTRADLAFYYALADAYTICDAYHCSVLGPTDPNRLYLWTGMIDPNGRGGGPTIDNSEPGYSWPTYPERLQQAGVSWKVYQQTDNYDDNALAWFTQYRNAAPGNPLHDRGMVFVNDLVAALKHDVTNGTLPRVSWLIAPTAASEHPPFAPASGAALTQKVMEALAADAATFNSTILILTYDENGGFFDHVPPPTPPAGTVDEFVNGQPIGLGVRVPLVLVSPWTRGGYVCSQVFDHTSVLRFLETWTGVVEPNISAWRRRLCGDLTSAFNFANPDSSYPSLPATATVNCPSGVTPVVPAPQSAPAQESGTKPARPLPYQLDATSFSDCAASRFSITLTNQGTAAAHVAIYANAFRTDGPWQYDVGPGGAVSDFFSVGPTGGGRYDLTCYGPNGFQRHFAGNISNACNQVEVTSSLDVAAGALQLAMRNSNALPIAFTLTANAYLTGGPWIYNVPPGNTVAASFLVLTNSNGWYDLTAKADNDTNFLRRFAGHLETGRAILLTPMILTQPAAQTVDAGTSASFSVTAVNGPLTYQWQLSGTNIPAATNSTFIITNVEPVNAGAYFVVVSNVNGAAKSIPAQLNVNTAPELLSQPVGEIADLGSSVSFAPPTHGGRPLFHRWFRNGAVVSTSLTNILALTNLKLSDAGNYQLVASNSYGAVTSLVAALKVYSGPLTNSLVVHLTFDNNFNDTSGRGNHAVYARNGANGDPSPTFVPGKIGAAFQYTTLADGTKFDYATLGYPADLRFGPATDFSVSMWVNYTNQSDDLPFVSNKDWAASANAGWGIFTQSGGNFRLNVTGPNSGADKFNSTPAPILRDGAWHHLAASFLRAPSPQSAFVYAYVDGMLVNKTPMSVVGTIDTDTLPFTFASPQPTAQTGWAVNIGQDGTGVYYDNGSAYDINARMDDFGIWRRALTANEAKGIYLAGRSGQDLSQALADKRLGALVSGGILHLRWSGSPNVQLQESATFAPALWTNVPGTLGAKSADVPMSGQGGFFRLAQ